MSSKRSSVVSSVVSAIPAKKALLTPFKQKAEAENCTDSTCAESLVWKSIPCSRAELNLNTLLACGQSFTWRKIQEGIWTNVINGNVYSLKQDKTQLYWAIHTAGEDNSTNVDEGKSDNPSIDDESHVAIIRDYFQLDVDLVSLYKQWSLADPHFAKIAIDFPGIRIIRQDPVENLFSFICSSNNHISRISSMVLKLCKEYGTLKSVVNGVEFYSFPSIASLAKSGVEENLRKLGFGYRAKFIAKSANLIMNNQKTDWLYNLRHSSYEQCIDELMTLNGVGRKVADCVALMSLDKTQVVPVDTHVLQIATRDYFIPGVHKNLKSLTPAVHNKIGDFFSDLFGDYAGWAHTVLFTADLKQFDSKSTKKIRAT